MTGLVRPTIRVMTWNIHGALGRNPRFDLDRVVALIRRHEPDVVALQEIDSRRTGQGGNPFEVLQQALGGHGVGAKSIVTADGEYGQALISRWPMEATEVRDISYAEAEPRRAIKCEIRTPRGTIRVISTHLGLSMRERRSQGRVLVEMIGEAATTTLALGDFNDWFWAGSVQKMLARALPGRTRHRTFPSICPLFCLDRIYCRPAGAMVGSFTDPAARHISDHLPALADIRMTQA